MTVPHTRVWGIGLAFVTACISGVAIFVNGYAVKHMPGPGPYTAAKNLVAALCIGAVLVVATARHSSEGWTPPRTRRERLALLVVGVFGGGVAFLLFFEGLSRASSTSAAFIQKTLVVWVAILAVAFLRERLGWPHLVAVATLVAGQALLIGDLRSIGFSSAEWMIFAATLLWAVEVVVAKRLLASLSPLTVGLARMSIGVVVLLGWLAVTGDLTTLVHLTGSQWGWVLLTGVILTGYVVTWFSALARAPAVDVTAVLVFGAIVTAALDGAFRGVPIRGDLVGLVLIGVGTAAVAVWAPRREPGTAVVAT